MDAITWAKGDRLKLFPRQRSASDEKPSCNSKASNPNHPVSSLEEMPRISRWLEAGEKTENAEPGDK
jgi:hypothetical protein